MSFIHDDPDFVQVLRFVTEKKLRHLVRLPFASQIKEAGLA